MEYNNENCTPLDRIDEMLVKELLAGRYDDDGDFCASNEPQGHKNDCLHRRNSRQDTRRRRAVPDDGPCRENNKENKPCGCTCRGGCAKYASGAGQRQAVGRAYTENNSPCVNNNDGVCGCGECDPFVNPTLHGEPLAMVYSPHQEWENLYDPEMGHSRGTVFRCLDFPFYPSRCSGKSSLCSCNRDGR